jgi:hypothetical protein
MKPLQHLQKTLAILSLIFFTVVTDPNRKTFSQIQFVKVELLLLYGLTLSVSEKLYEIESELLWVLGGKQEILLEE